MLRLLSDQNFNEDIVRGLLRRQHDLNLARARDVARESGEMVGIPWPNLVRARDVALELADDPAVLAWAADSNRIVLTHDRATMPDFAYKRVAAALPMGGLFVVNDRSPIRQVIDDLLLIEACSEQAEWAGLVLYLPL